MTQTARNHIWEEQRPAFQITAKWHGVLNALRVTALSCRSAAREDLFHACALLSTSKPTAQDAHARALFRCLTEATGRKAVFYRPGEVSLSFDEQWLIRLIMCAKAQDYDSVTFLIRSRVSPIHQRHVSFLIKGISEQFCLD